MGVLIPMPISLLALGLHEHITAICTFDQVPEGREPKVTPPLLSKLVDYAASKSNSSSPE